MQFTKKNTLVLFFRDDGFVATIILVFHRPLKPLLILPPLSAEPSMELDPIIQLMHLCLLAIR